MLSNSSSQPVTREPMLSELSTPGLFDRMLQVQQDQTLDDIERQLMLEMIENELDLREQYHINGH